MGLLTPDDPGYDPSIRQTGFKRYKQLLSFYGVHWFQVGLLTVVGAMPLATGVTLSVLSSSLLLLLPCSIAGGMIFGPFLAGMFDAVLRGLRDDPNNWWTNYKKSWRQNWTGSLLPGAFLGLFAGVYAFMAHLFWWARRAPSPGTVALYLFSGLVLVIFTTLYWPQLVLFRQTIPNRLRNIILFTAKYLWKVTGAALVQMLYLAILILFAPWSLILIPILGAWYIIFLSQFMLYNALNAELQIEEQFAQAEESEVCFHADGGAGRQEGGAPDVRPREGEWRPDELHQGP